MGELIAQLLGIIFWPPVVIVAVIAAYTIGYRNRCRKANKKELELEVEKLKRKED